MHRLIAPMVFLTLLFAAAMIFGGSHSPSQPDRSLISQFKVNDTPKGGVVTDQEGASVELESLFGNKTLLTFWSSQCRECEEGLTVIGKFSERYPEVTVILVNFRDPMPLALQALERLSPQLKSYFDFSGKVYQSWLATLPSSYYIEQGKILYFFPGRVGADHLEAIMAP